MLIVVVSTLLTTVFVAMYFRYQLAENIDSQMRRLADDLKEIIERMNAASRQHEATADPVNSSVILFSIFC